MLLSLCHIWVSLTTLGTTLLICAFSDYTLATMLTPSFPQRKLNDLDYNVRLPAVFRFRRDPLRNDPFWRDRDSVGFGLFTPNNNANVSLYLSDPTERDSYTLRQIFDGFANFAGLVIKITDEMREAQFEASACASLLDYFYNDDPIDWQGRYPSKDDNYYYVFANPELRALEIALEVLESPLYWYMDVSKVRRAAFLLKLRLWQSLPDFYRGHVDPMSQPLSYDTKQPYPYNYIAESIVDEHPPPRLFFDNYERLKSLEQYLPNEASTQATTISVTPRRKGVGATITSETGDSTSIDLATAFAPQLDILDFVENIISNCDPAYMAVDPEAPNIHFLTYTMSNRELVGLVIAYETEYSSYQYNHVFSGVYNRRELARELLKICEDKENYFYDIGDDHASTIAFRLERLKALM